MAKFTRVLRRVSTNDKLWDEDKQILLNNANLQNREVSDFSGLSVSDFADLLLEDEPALNQDRADSIAEYLKNESERMGEILFTNSNSSFNAFATNVVVPTPSVVLSIPEKLSEKDFFALLKLLEANVKDTSIKRFLEKTPEFDFLKRELGCNCVVRNKGKGGLLNSRLTIELYEIVRKGKPTDKFTFKGNPISSLDSALGIEIQVWVNTLDDSSTIENGYSAKYDLDFSLLENILKAIGWARANSYYALPKNIDVLSAWEQISKIDLPLPWSRILESYLDSGEDFSLKPRPESERNFAILNNLSEEQILKSLQFKALGKELFAQNDQGLLTIEPSIVSKINLTNCNNILFENVYCVNSDIIIQNGKASGTLFYIKTYHNPTFPTLRGGDSWKGVQLSIRETAMKLLELKLITIEDLRVGQ